MHSKMFMKHFRRKMMCHNNVAIAMLMVSVLLSLIYKITAEGVFELEILEISNPNSHVLNGYCCGLPLEIRNTKRSACPPCATAFRLCLKEWQEGSVRTEQNINLWTGCSFGNTTTGILGHSSFVLDKPPVMSVPFTFRWTKSVTLILQALDMYNESYPDSERLIGETAYSGIVLPSPEWQTLQHPDHLARNARITYRVRVQCALNYYNTTCTTLCRPRNDSFGHYTCGPDGQKVCLDGWQGANCEQTICKQGCNLNHGSCTQPGECECRRGWKGPLCDECMVYPNCSHGSCNGVPWACVCDTNWGGMLCNQDLNCCGTQEPCLHGGTCENTKPNEYRCTCADGLSGKRCEIVEHPCATQPCRNGGTCTILKGSANVTTPPPFRAMHGRSSAMGTPVNRRGSRPGQFTGSSGGGAGSAGATNAAININNNSNNNNNNNEDTQSKCEAANPSSGKSGGGVSSAGGSTSTFMQLHHGSHGGGHQHGQTPLHEFTCECATGWTGPTCEINIDECAGGPCEHGGTCIDLIGGFRCECPPAWTGDVCQSDVNECEATYTLPAASPNTTSLAILAALTADHIAVPSVAAAALSGVTSPLGPCINARKCINQAGSFSCVCQEGWGGSTCANNLDDCDGQCRNGATCMDLVNAYHCVCATGFTGRDCETDINECANSPCRNNGECVDMVGKFKCICPLGYSGSLCEEARNHCTSSPCQQGRCLNTPGSYYCHCPPDRAGKHCEQARPLCSQPPCNDGCYMNVTTNATPCSGHGTCEVGDVGTFCKCHVGHTGTFCEHNLNECSPNPCRNGGICLDGDGDFTCECMSGWTGKRCSDRATECFAGQCQNGGTCQPAEREKGLPARCSCTAGWNGLFCAERIDQCLGQPCHNGGTCESGIGWFRCLCAVGFSGPDCRINVNECSPQPCQGGATCIDGIGGYTCKCPPGRHGVRCEILMSDPKSACSNANDTLSPYHALSQSQDWLEMALSDRTDEYCNACVCENGTSRCTNLWCGLPNCRRVSATAATTTDAAATAQLGGVCKPHEVCVPTVSEACLSPPCTPRGDCRKLEPSRRVAPPSLPARLDCWPNQVTLNSNCARLSVLVDLQHISAGSSVEGLCSVMRFLLAARLVKLPLDAGRGGEEDQKGMLIVICDLKSGTSDTIEVTVSSTKSNDSKLPIAIGLLGELLSSRQLNSLQRGHDLHNATLAPLISILEVRVETALTTENNNSSLLVGILCGILIVLIGFAIFLGLMWRQRMAIRSVSGINLAPSMDALRHEEEKSNNLQNEENLRRYTNPLKGSTTSLGRGSGMELSLNPAPELRTVSALVASSSGGGRSSAEVHRSQPLYPPRESNFECELDVRSATVKRGNGIALRHAHHVPAALTPKRHSQLLLLKTQNADMKKNTMGTLDSPRKDFGKRSINCKSMPPPADVESDVGLHSPGSVSAVLSVASIGSSASISPPALSASPATSDILTVMV